jgi:hypothetical protein
VYGGCGSVNRKIVLAAAIVIAVVIVVSLLLVANPFWSTKQWRFLENPSGNSNYYSPVFTVNNTWRIKWAYNNSTANLPANRTAGLPLFLLQVFVKQDYEFPPLRDEYVDSDEMNETSGILYVNSVGTFKYVVLALVPWNLTVEESL